MRTLVLAPLLTACSLGLQAVAPVPSDVAAVSDTGTPLDTAARDTGSADTGSRDTGADTQDTGPRDRDGDGHIADDCDDADAGAFPGANEIIGDGVDQDCNGRDTTLVVADGATGSIDDWTTSTFSASVTGCPSPSDVTVSVQLSHDFLADVVVSLEGPGGTNELLWDGNVSWNWVDTVLDQAWELPAARTVNGGWTLVVEDDGWFDEGWVDAWWLSMTCD